MKLKQKLKKAKKVVSDNQETDRFPITPEYNSRTIAYLTISASAVTGVYAGYLSNLYILMVVLALVYPHLAKFLTAPIREKYTAQVVYTLILFDAVMYGAVSVLLGASPIPTMLLAIMANASFITTGKAFSYIFCLLFMAAGALATFYLMPNQLQIMGDAPDSMAYVFAIGVGIYVGVTAYYNHKQSRMLLAAKNQMQQRNEQYRRLSQKLSKYLSPQVWQTIFSGKKDVKLETHRKKLVIFFSDIQGFTALSEEIEPETLTDILNRYLTDMSKIALKHGGTIDKFIGDAIMVFFGDPESKGLKKDTEACVSMAIEMRRHMKVLRQRWRAQGLKTPLEIRMGINTGYATVGNFGAESRMDYTIIGKEVNLAARLESAADAGEILISYETYSVVKDTILCREKGQIHAKGFSRPVPIYQVVDFRRDLGSQQSFTEYEFDGFSMHLDLEKVKNYEKDRIVSALEKAEKLLKEKLL
ncbi:adenylate/guanylate cyclase domain-containing protein [Gynuella sunshinyii]|uniref:Adenylate cyclase, family 3 (Some protein containing HAMP domain) n=1 Tax=Gynuella sunshinyii YC6258 TaxID=1445510 RepID=A0A0C5VWY9_9GAMM|nr:adenylate/guanylate cyclase domain-containing protein [Gynuella sunshinyii]AJQ94974.1 adenylate cyclase, family 3 (some protein containing HAMP domain) [Gynuella sunshinyii YC6258]